jgi:ATP-dependent helicase HepA
MTLWKPGDRLTHRYNPELGTGRIRMVEDRTVVVEFPGKEVILRLASDSNALVPLVLRPGSRAILQPGGETVIIESLPTAEGALLADGREVNQEDLWPLQAGESCIDRLALGDLDPLEQFALRMDALQLEAMREADGLGSFLGGRIRLFPHQLHVAGRATMSDPVRWLLADEVGLGKTVEACLVLNHLVRTRRTERTLVVAPPMLTVQWLGELWRKYHQVFVLLDDNRLADVEKDYGPGFNPFDAYRQVVVSLDLLVENRHLVEQAVKAGIDLLIVDEAHHLRRAPGHPGNAAYRAIKPIAELGRHLLLLTATPLEDDAHGFFRLLQLLRPEEFSEESDFTDHLERGEALPPCTSATKREDIGGLPPRQPFPVNLSDDERWRPQERLVEAMRKLPAKNAVAQRNKIRKISRALASGASAESLIVPSDNKNRQLARLAMRTDPRIDWLAHQAPHWRSLGEKTLVFVAHRESLEAIKTAMSRLAQLRVSVFHEELSPGQHDIEVAQFRMPGGPSMLVSTESGGEGRNFEFCTRLVLFDMPWNPMSVEQRIGRLDRIGRQIPVEIVYFRPPRGLGAAVVGLYESLGLFLEPLGGLQRQLADVEGAIEELALSETDRFHASRFAEIIDGAREASSRIRQAAYHESHRDPYRPHMADAILSRIPEGLEELTKEVVLAACEQLDFHVEDHSAASRYSIEFGQRARVESLPGVAGGSSFLGTFSRESAVQDESIDFYASGHPLVEGLLDYLEEWPGGRTALLDIKGDDGAEGFGLLALYRSELGFEAVAIDAHGRERPGWAELITRRPLRSRRVKQEQWTGRPEWPTLVRSLASMIEERGRPAAVAAFRIGP